VLGASRRGERRELLWNLGVAPLFVAAAAVGGELGDVALAARRVERTRERDRATLDAAGGDGQHELRRVAERVSETATEVERALLRIAAAHRSREHVVAREVRTAVAEVRGGIEHHLLGPALVAAANERPLDLTRTLRGICDLYRNGWGESGAAIAFSSRPASGLQLDARVTSVLVRATKVALDNVYEHQQGALLRVTVELASDPRAVTLRIADDGGADCAPAPEQWGTGLTETLAQVRELGGELTLERSGAGLALSVVLPAAAGRVPAPTPASLDRRIEDALDRCARWLRPAAWLNGLSCCLLGRSPRGRRAAAASFTGLVAIDRLWNARAPEDCARSAAIVPLVSLLWPRGGLPATGWTGLELISLGARGRRGHVLALGAVASGGTLLGERRARSTVALARRVENVAFPAVCALSGIAAASARRLLRGAESESVSLRERAELIEHLARAVRLRHEIVKPLRRSPVWYEQGIMESEDGQRLLALSGDVDALARRLLALIAVADPVSELQEHLQLRLDPAPVSVSGMRPVWTAERAREAGVERAREHLAVVALADELADWLLACFPPRLRGVPRLRSLRLQIEPVEEHEVRVALHSEPRPNGRSDPDTRGLRRALERISGRLERASQSGALSFVLPATALASP
jgi:type III secretion system FlhB-like substrate exporter